MDDYKIVAVTGFQCNTYFPWHGESYTTSARLPEFALGLGVEQNSVQCGLENRELPPNCSARMESRTLATTLGELWLNWPVDFAAWSYGALITLDYALDYSSLVRSLTLIEPPAFCVLRATGALDTEAEQTGAILQTLHGDMSER